MPHWTAVTTPCRGSLSSCRQAVDINFPLREKQNLLCFHSFSGINLHMQCVQLHRFHVFGYQLSRCNVILHLYSESLLVPARQVLWLSICLLAAKNSMHQSCILRSAIVDSAHAHSLTVMWTDAVSVWAHTIMGAMSITWHPFCFGKEREWWLEKCECARVSWDLWDLSGGIRKMLFNRLAN